MRIRTLAVALVLLGILLATGPAAAQTPPAEQQITAALQAAPPALRDSATVLGYTNGSLTPLREREGQLICLADQPGDDRFHVACYHRSLEPFMARSRALRAQGLESSAVDSMRQQEIEAGTLAMPEQAAALYSLTGPADSFDPATGTVTGARPLHVVYLPFATAESTGLPTHAPPGQPWIMAPGQPWAHIMIVGPEPAAPDTTAGQ